MKFLIRKCEKCFEYTLLLKCKRCQSSTNIVHPAKFSPDDKYLKYRILEKF